MASVTNDLNSPMSTSSSSDEADENRDENGDDGFIYSEVYADDKFEFRHVMVPDNKHYRPRLMTEAEWRALGVKMSPGWIHYALHRPEPKLLLFRRLITN